MPVSRQPEPDESLPASPLCSLEFLMARHARDSISVCRTWWVLPGHCCSRRLPTPGQDTPAPACALGVPTACRTCPSACQGHCWALGTPLLRCGVRAPPRCPPVFALWGCPSRATRRGRVPRGQGCAGCHAGTSPWTGPMKEPLFSRRCWDSSEHLGRGGAGVWRQHSVRCTRGGPGSAGQCQLTSA